MTFNRDLKIIIIFLEGRRGWYPKTYSTLNRKGGFVLSLSFCIWISPCYRSNILNEHTSQHKEHLTTSLSKGKALKRDPRRHRHLGLHLCPLPSTCLLTVPLHQTLPQGLTHIPASYKHLPAPAPQMSASYCQSSLCCHLLLVPKPYMFIKRIRITYAWTRNAYTHAEGTYVKTKHTPTGQKL